MSKKSIYLQLLARFAVGLSVVFMPELIASESVHWDYSGEHGPAHWAELSSDYTTCGDGVHQSPIDIVKPVVAALQPLRYEYHSRGTSIVNNGHTLQINAEPGSRLIAEGEPFDLLQVHFHSPSEHRINSELFLMEAHFVHQNARGELAVVAVFYREGPRNELLEQLGALAPEEVGSVEKLALDFGQIPGRTDPGAYYRYSGSLTTPPCTENVRWFVMKSIHTVAIAQRDRFVELIGEDARGLQPLNSRIVLER